MKLIITVLAAAIVVVTATPAFACGMYMRETPTAGPTQLLARAAKLEAGGKYAAALRIYERMQSGEETAASWKSIARFAANRLRERMSAGDTAIASAEAPAKLQAKVITIAQK
jgi:hypothetical protein